MPMIIQCPGCKQRLRLPDDLLGQPVQCPACGETFQATDGAGPMAPAPRPLETTGPGASRDNTEESRPLRKPVDWGDDDADSEYRSLDDEHFGRGRGSSHAAAKSLVSGPAIALIVVGGLAIGFAVLALGMNVLAVGIPQPRPMQPEERIGNLVGGVIGSIVGACWGIFVLAGAFQMLNLRNYGLAMSSAIVAMVPCCSLCCVLGLPFGIWALVALNNPEVKAAFR